MGGSGFLGLGPHQQEATGDFAPTSPTDTRSPLQRGIDASDANAKALSDSLAVPTPNNSSDALDSAAARERQARGAQATIFAGRQRAGLAGAMDSGQMSNRMLLGS